jgi:hypothetical protein
VDHPAEGLTGGEIIEAIDLTPEPSSFVLLQEPCVGACSTYKASLDGKARRIRPQEKPGRKFGFSLFKSIAPAYFFFIDSQPLFPCARRCNQLSLAFTRYALLLCLARPCSRSWPSGPRAVVHRTLPPASHLPERQHHHDQRNRLRAQRNRPSPEHHRLHSQRHG